MAGYSDVPYRAICRAHGSAMHYTEFVAAELLQGRPNYSGRSWIASLASAPWSSRFSATMPK